MNFEEKQLQTSQGDLDPTQITPDGAMFEDNTRAVNKTTTAQGDQRMQDSLAKIV